MDAVVAENLTVVYERVRALEDVSFRIPRGSMTAVIGPNGSGKSTLLKACIGLVKPVSGRISVLSMDVNGVRGKVAYVPQREEVYWDYPITVWDVVAMGRIREVGPLRSIRRDDEEVAKALEATGLTELSHRKISDLSGGQQQRVFLARAIAQGSELYLLDEPLTGVDAESEDRLFEILAEIREKGKTILMTTHDLSSTLEIFDYVLLLRNRLISFGPPQESLKTEYLAAAYGSESVAMHLADIRRVAGWR